MFSQLSMPNDKHQQHSLLLEALFHGSGLGRHSAKSWADPPVMVTLTVPGAHSRTAAQCLGRGVINPWSHCRRPSCSLQVQFKKDCLGKEKPLQQGLSGPEQPPVLALSGICDTRQHHHQKQPNWGTRAFCEQVRPEFPGHISQCPQTPDTPAVVPRSEVSAIHVHRAFHLP